MRAMATRGIHLCSLLVAWTIVGTGWGALPATESEMTSTPETEPPHPSLSIAEESLAERFYGKFIKERLSAGVRVTSFSLTHSERPPDESRRLTFIGYVNELQEDNNNLFHPTILYKIHRHVAVEFTMDSVSAKTVNFNNHLADGDVVMSGPIVNLILSYPIFKDRLAPYVGLGYASWRSTFDHNAWWRLGWDSPDAFEAAGRPDKVHGRYERQIAVEDEAGILWTLGVNARLHRYAELDLMIRKIDLEAKAEHGVKYENNGVYEKRREGEFTLDHIAIGCALRVIF